MCAPHCSIAFALALHTFLMCPFYRGDLNKNHNEQNRSLRVFSSLKLTSLASGPAFHILLNSLSLARSLPLLDFYTQNKGPALWKLFEYTIIVYKLNCDGHRKPQTRFKPHSTEPFFPLYRVFLVGSIFVCACVWGSGTGENLLHHRFSNWNDDWFGFSLSPD